MVPTFLLTVGVASGPVTVGAGYQLMLLLIYGTEKILLGVVLPLIYSYCLLTMINGIWVEEKLALLADLLEKLIGWILKASLGVVTGISLFQSLITPVVDSLKIPQWRRLSRYCRGSEMLRMGFWSWRWDRQL